MRKKIRLSLIIPTYNCALYLDETLNSVLCQMLDDCELIVVDDGSTDDTPGLLKAYEKKRDGLRVSLRNHEGVSKTRNAGIDLAEGEWISFMDCDDTLKKDFFRKALPLLDDETELYVFSFEKVELSDDEEIVAPLTVEDRIYESVSDFADSYVRTRHLLVYSSCNKFYKKDRINRYGIRFRDDLAFGEDRLFNYDYLMHCGRVRTQSLGMFRYMQRNPDSASNRSFPDYFNTIMMLHQAKMNCFLSLSKGTTGSEKRAFSGYDLATEVERMIDRFEKHPDEKEENLPRINDLLFEVPDDTSGRYDILIVLGSRNCGYRIEKAYETAAQDPDTVFVVSGGNTHKDGDRTEAEFMTEYLHSRGIEKSRILIEEQAENTYRNLELSTQVIEKAMLDGRIRTREDKLRIGIVTAGFHVRRTRKMVKMLSWYDDKDIVFISSYGSSTGPDNWYDNPMGRNIVLGEIAKYTTLSE